MRTEIKKICAAVLCLAMLIPGFCVVSSAEISPELVLDMNNDGAVKASDARALLRFVAGLEQLSPTPEQVKAVAVFGDLNGDGYAKAADARLLLRYAAGLTKFADLKINLHGELPDIPDTQNAELIPHALLSPKTDHGLGTAPMIITTQNYCETMPAGTENDISSPRCSSYLTGMIDYVTGTEYYSSGVHYATKNNIKIHSDNADYFTGYIMPENKVEVTAVEGNSDSTSIYVRTDWAVPVTIALGPQSYYVGYGDRPYNVYEFTATGIDLCFAYSASAGGVKLLPSDGYLSGMTWQKTSNGVSLHMDFDHSDDYRGVLIELLSEGYYKFTFNYKGDGLSGKTIILDNGHGGSDPGGGGGGVFEGPINLNICTYMAAILKAKGAKVIITNPEYRDLTLVERKVIARENDADLFVSIHGNSSTSSSAHGVETFYFYPFSKKLATLTQEALVSAYDKIYSPIDANYHGVDRGEKYWAYGVTRLESCPAILLEYGFLTNYAEREVLQSQTNQQKIAAELASAIEKFFEE